MGHPDFLELASFHPSGGIGTDFVTDRISAGKNSLPI